MILKIWNYKSHLIKSIFLDLLIFLLLSKIYEGIFNYVTNFSILILSVWIILSYIAGRYHDFKEVNKVNIIKSIFKTFFLSFFLINFYFVLERVFYYQFNIGFHLMIYHISTFFMGL